MLAKDIMNKSVIAVQKDATIEEVARILTEHNVSGAPVVNAEGKMVGIVTEGDLLHKETNPRAPFFLNILGAFIYISGVERYREDFKKLAATRVSEMMTTKVFTVSENTEIEQVAALMVNHNIKRVPVVEKDALVGIISRADIVRTLAQRA